MTVFRAISMPTNRLINIATLVLVVCALTVTGLVVRRELFATPRRTAAASRAPQRVTEWRSVADGGRIMGPANSAVVITEFSDFQCPYCRRLAPTLKQLRSKYVGQVAVSYRHFPLPRHEHAVAAALASECASEQGRFEEYHDALFQQADSIGKKAWAEFASSAGVANRRAFEQCMSDSTHLSRVNADLAAGQELRVTGTPTVLVNEWRLRGTPALGVLDSIIQAEITRRKR